MSKQKSEVVIPTGRLWPMTPWGAPMEIEIFGATGEFATGKTILGLSIAPGVHPEGHPFAGKPRTLYLDLEKSGATYGGTGCQRIDVPEQLAKTYGPNYTAKQAAEWFNAIPSRLQPGQFDVIVVDPINDIEAGEVDVVRSEPAKHGFTKNQFDNSVALLMSAMKAHWKRLLMTFPCKCFYFTTHLRDEFRGGKPSGKREPRGKETLAELASLYLWLERAPDDKGNVPDKPSAIVIKQRLADTRMNAAGELEIVNLMPPRIPVATVQSIRAYIANPPNYAKLSAEEKVIEKPVTEVEMQRMKLATAEAQKEAATAQVAILDRQQELMALRQKAQANAPQTADRTAQVQAAAQEKREIEARMASAETETRRLMVANNPVANAPADKLREYLAAGIVSTEKLKAAVAFRNADRFTLLPPNDQEEVLAWIGTLAECKRLIESLGLAEEKVQSILANAGAKNLDDLTASLAASLRDSLQKALDARKQLQDRDGPPW